MEIKIVDLPAITVIGKEGLCTAEKNIVQQLWQEANFHFNEDGCSWNEKFRWDICWILGSNE